jgi:hypothetical protein
MGKHTVVESGAIAEVWRLLKHGIDIPPAWNTSLVDELKMLSAGHMPVLMYKRAKFNADLRWQEELREFVSDKICPHLAKAGVPISKSHVADVLDEIVATESLRESAREAALPLTSRFDTSWAV